MKDYKLKQRNLRASHTLGWSIIGTFFCFLHFFGYYHETQKNAEEEGKQETR
jgi:hypothetical protein